MVDVVEQPDRDAPLLRGEKRREDERAGVGFEAHVVERQVEARAGGTDERGNLTRDLRRLLTAVAERPQLDRHQFTIEIVGGARPHRGLAGALGCLILGERLRGVDVAELSCLGANSSQPCGRTSRRFARTPIIVRAFISPIPGRASSRRSRSAPSRASVHTEAASPPYSLVEERTVLLHPAGHIGGEAVQRRLLAEHLFELVGLHRRDRHGVEPAEPLRELER